jgi:hypothetical protein
MHSTKISKRMIQLRKKPLYHLPNLYLIVIVD